MQNPIRIAIVATLAAIAMTTAGVLATPGTAHAAAPVMATTVTARSTGAARSTVAVVGDAGVPLGTQSDRAALLRGADRLGARTIVASTATSRALADTTLRGSGPNALERSSDLRAKNRTVRRAMTAIAAEAPHAAGSARQNAGPAQVDVFSTLVALAGTMHASGTDRGSSRTDVVLFSSLLNDAAPLDLTHPETLTDPTAAIDTLAAAGLVPECRGWRFSAVRPSSPALAPAADAALETFWRAYAERCGGRLVAWTTSLATFPGSGREVAALDTRQLAVTSVGDGVQAALRGDVLFATGSPALGPDAEGALEQLLAVVEQHTGAIAVTGYTDDTRGPGGAAANVRLSGERSAAVAAWLEQHGVAASRITTAGKGEADPAVPNATTPAQLAANRRVVVTIGG